MPFPGNTFYRSELTHSILKELDEHNAVLNGFLAIEHGPDGNHTNITAESITAGLVSANVMASYLRLNPSKTYTVKPNDPNGFVTVASDPDVSFWYAESAADVTIHGMYVKDLLRGIPGHVQLIVNDSPFTHTYASAVVTNACRLYGCVTPVVVPPGGTILFVYDGENLGWRYVGSSAGSGTGEIELPPYIAFTNISNPWTAAQSFPGVTVNGPSEMNGTIAVSGNAVFAGGVYVQYPGFGGWLLTQTAGTAAFNLSYPGGAANAITAQWDTGRVGIGTATPAAKLSIVGGGALWTNNAWGRAIELSTATVIKWPRVSTVAWGLGATGDNFYIFYSAAEDTSSAPGYMATFSADGFVTLNALKIANPYLYVGGYRVDVTANCSIPGSGGGVELPPNMAFLNVVQNWPAYQRFDGGLSWAGTDLGVYLNQAVRTDASPTFAGLTVNGPITEVGRLTINAAADPDSLGLAVTGRITGSMTIEAGNAFVAQGHFGRTATLTISGTTMIFVGGILVNS